MFYKEMLEKLIEYCKRPDHIRIIAQGARTFGDPTNEELESDINFTKKFFALQKDKDYDRIKEMIDEVIDTKQINQIIMLSRLELPESLAVYFIEKVSGLKDEKNRFIESTVINEILSNSGKNFSEENQVKYGKEYSVVIINHLPRLKYHKLDFEISKINLKENRPNNFFPQKMLDAAILEYLEKGTTEISQYFFITSDDIAKEVLAKVEEKELNPALFSPKEKFQFKDKVKNALLNNENLSEELRMKIAEDCNIDFKLLFGVPEELLKQYYFAMVSAYTEQELNPSNYNKDREKFMREHKINGAEMLKLENIYEEAEDALQKIIASGRLSEDIERDLTNRMMAFNLRASNPILEDLAKTTKIPSVCLDLSKSRSVIVKDEALANPHIPLERVEELLEKKFNPLDKKGLSGMHYNKETENYKITYVLSQIRDRGFGDYTGKLLSYPATPIINSIAVSFHTPLKYLSKLVNGEYDKTFARMEIPASFTNSYKKKTNDLSEPERVEMLKKYFGGKAYLNYFVRSGIEEVNELSNLHSSDKIKISYKNDKISDNNVFSTRLYDIANSMVSELGLPNSTGCQRSFSDNITSLFFVFSDKGKLNKEEIYRYQDLFKKMYENAPDYLSSTFEYIYNDFKLNTDNLISIVEKDIKDLTDNELADRIQILSTTFSSYPFIFNVCDNIDNPYFENIDVVLNDLSGDKVNSCIQAFKKYYAFSEHIEEIEEAVKEIQRRDLLKEKEYEEKSER